MYKRQILDHSIKCSGFLFEEKKAPRKIVKSAIKKYNIPFEKINSLKYGADWIDSSGMVISNNILTTPNTPPYRYAFCSDTRYNESIISKIQGVDLLYHETTFMHDLQERAYETGHSTTIEAAMIAKESDVKHMMIGHYSQRYKKLEDLLMETKKIFTNTSLSVSGMVIDFNTI